MQHGPVVLAVIVDYGRRILLGRLRCFGARWQPRTFGDPIVIQLPRLGDGKSSLRDTSLEAFIDNSEIKRHGNGRGLVRTCVVELAIHHDDDGNEERLASAGKLNQPESARSQVSLLATVGLGQFLGGERSRGNRQSGQRRPEDDGSEPLAV